MPSAVPPALVGSVGETEHGKLESWWDGLDETSRNAITELCSGGGDIALERDWFGVSIELHGRFIDPEDALEQEMWTEDLIEYINNRPEMRFHLEERRFHICRAHAAAREIVRTGVIHGHFTCPAANDACPFEAASDLGDGRALVLVPSLRRCSRSTISRT
jgi:hypothetical protein